MIWLAETSLFEIVRSKRQELFDGSVKKVPGISENSFQRLVTITF